VEWIKKRRKDKKKKKKKERKRKKTFAFLVPGSCVCDRVYTAVSRYTPEAKTLSLSSKYILYYLLFYLSLVQPGLSLPRPTRPCVGRGNFVLSRWTVPPS
jgi:hypothetical protein